jgi:hypothetical protein
MPVDTNFSSALHNSKFPYLLANLENICDTAAISSFSLWKFKFEEYIKDSVSYKKYLPTYVGGSATIIKYQVIKSHV